MRYWCGTDSVQARYLCGAGSVLVRCGFGAVLIWCGTYTVRYINVLLLSTVPEKPQFLKIYLLNRGELQLPNLS